MSRLLNWTTRFAEWINEVIGHPVTFLVALVGTDIWTGFILTTHFDPHGFWFLYLATAVSFVTQFTLTLVGLQAKREAHFAAERAAEGARRQEETQRAILATMSAVHAIVQAVKHTMEEDDEILEEIRDAITDERE